LNTEKKKGFSKKKREDEREQTFPPVYGVVLYPSQLKFPERKCEQINESADQKANGHRRQLSYKLRARL